jgi:hypothetical protein
MAKKPTPLSKILVRLVIVLILFLMVAAVLKLLNII